MISRDDCIYARYVNSNGYGRVRHNGKTILAHRLAYCQNKGIDLSEIDGLLIRHKCDNPPCINPDHLETGNHKDNARDMVERGRAINWLGIRRGEGNPKSKVTRSDVEAIRARYKFYSAVDGTTAIARDYKISHRTVVDIVKMRTWNL